MHVQVILILFSSQRKNIFSIPDGVTIHSAFGFKFGNEHQSLSDQKKKELRTNLSYLKLLIIDEMSLLGSDMLYRIHTRLCEVFQTESLFGNRSVVLVGDLLQLPPVKANYIFEEPSRDSHLKAFHSASNIFGSFLPHVLKHNHRQGDSKIFANTLNRIREGILTEEDMKLLENRFTSEEFLDDQAMHIFYTNKEVNDHNEKMLEKLDGAAVTMKANKIFPKGYVSKDSPHGTIDNTQFMKNLVLKIGARCVLVFNINVIDCLVNGSSGTVVGIEYKDDVPYCVIVKFDDSESGKEQRAKYPNLAKKYEKENGTPIFPQELEYQVLSRKGYGHAMRAKIIQFPLKLFYASTAHKMQGQTIKAGSKVIIHWHQNMTKGMAYVMLGRCERLEDIYIAGNDILIIHFPMGQKEFKKKK